MNRDEDIELRSAQNVISASLSWNGIYFGICALKLHNIPYFEYNIVLHKIQQKKEYSEKYEAYKIEHKHGKRYLIYFVRSFDVGACVPLGFSPACRHFDAVN